MMIPKKDRHNKNLIHHKDHNKDLIHHNKVIHHPKATHNKLIRNNLIHSKAIHNSLIHNRVIHNSPMYNKVMPHSRACRWPGESPLQQWSYNKQSSDRLHIWYCRASSSGAATVPWESLPSSFLVSDTWWRHEMEPCSVLLAICAGNSPVTGEFPTQRPVTRSFDVFFDLRPNQRLSKQLQGWWFETPSRPLWRHCNDVCSCRKLNSKEIYGCTWNRYLSQYQLYHHWWQRRLLWQHLMPPVSTKLASWRLSVFSA